MARLVTTGFEARDVDSSGNSIDGMFSNAPPTFDAGVFRSGLYSAKWEGAASRNWLFLFTGALNRDYFARACIRFPAAPTTAADVLALQGRFAARLTSTRTLQLWNIGTGNAQIGSDSAALSVDTWYRLELRVRIGTGATDEADLRLDGTSVASTTTADSSDAAPGNLQVGWVSTPGTSSIIYTDDIALNDDQGASQNSWPGDGKVVLLLPISDNARDTKWTGGAGGTTDLWDAVNNTPPVGTATETDATQIEHAGGAAGTTDRYDANMTTPATAGIGASDTINTAHFIEVDGEDIATGAKLLNFEVLSNPVIASPGNVTAGDNVGALGTYPTNWSGRTSPPVYGPTLDVGTSPVMRAGRPETASRVASVCFMGIYVDYTPGVAAEAVPHSWIPTLGPILAQ